MKLASKLGLGTLGIVLVLVALGLWLLATESGARIVFATAKPYLPAELVLGTPTGSLLGGVCVDAINWNSGSLELDFRNACVDIELTRLLARHLAVRSLDVDELRAELSDTTGSEPSGELPTFESPLDISVESSSLRSLSFISTESNRYLDEVQFSGALSGSKLEISGLSVRSDWLNADLDGNVEFAGLYPGRLDLSWQWSESPTLQLAGTLKLSGDIQRYELTHSLTAPQRLITTGNFSYVANELSLDLANTWDTIDWPVGELRLQSSGGSLRLQGNPGSLDVTLNASSDYGQLLASGNVGWSPQRAFDVEFALSDLDPSLASELLQGEVGVSGRASGSMRANGPELTVLIEDLDGTVNGHPLGGSGRVDYASSQLSVSDGKVQLGKNSVDVRGSVGDQLSLDGELDLPAIDELLPGAAGRVSGAVSMRGSREQPEIRLRATGADVAWSEYAIGGLTVAADLDSSKRVSADIDLRELALRGEDLDYARVAVEGVLDRHTVRAELVGRGTQVNADVSGGYLDSTWVGRVDSLAVNSELAGLWSSPEPAEMSASADAISLSRLCLVHSTESGSACVETSTSKTGATTFDLDVRSLPLGMLPLGLPQNVSLSGLGSAQARGTYSEGRLTGDGSVGLQKAKIDAEVDGENVSVVLTDAVLQATAADNRLTSSLLVELAGGAGVTKLDLAIGDVTDFGSAIEGRGEAAITDLSLVAIFVPDLSNPRGVIGGNLDISGTLSEPELLGAIEVTDGSFRVRQAGIEIKELNARLSQTSPGRLRFEGSAKSGDGLLAIQGDTWVSAETGIRSEVLLTGENFELARLPDWQLVASPTIAVVFDDRKANVTGNLLIPNANIRVKELPQTATSPSPDAIVHEQQGAQSAARRRIDVDIAVNLGEDVSFTGFGLSTSIDGVVRLRGGTHSPYTGAGKLSLREGRYKAYGQDLEIERGELIFNGPLENPQLDVRAVRRTTDVVAGIQLSGTPSQLRSSVFSEPPLRDVEALSYLLTGRPLSSATSTGEGDTLNAAAFALGVSSAGTIVSQVQSGLGLETLAVEGGTQDGRLIAGKRFGDRLLVEYGYGLIDKLGTLLLRYQLTDRITLESRTGTVSNLDILYSVKKK